MDISAIENGTRTYLNRDLVPVCPNCHAMIHRGGANRTLAEIRAMMRQRPSG